MKATLTRSSPALARAALATVLAAAVVAACKSPLLGVVLEETAVAVTPPALSAIYPVASASDIPVNAEISITFTKNIDASTVSGTTLPIKDSVGSTVGGRYGVDAATVTFTATGGFRNGETYTATITLGVLDTDGNPLSEEYVWTFVTSLTPDVSAPAISALTLSSASLVSVDGSDWSGTMLVSATVTASDDRGIAQVMLSDNSAFSGASWTTYSQSSPSYQFEFSAPDGQKRLYAKVKDGAGNVSEAASSAPLYVDTAPPTASNLLVNNGASATSSASVDLRVNATDASPSSGLTNFRYRQSGGSWSAWQALSLDSGSGSGSVAGFALSSGLGETATLEAQVVDRVGNLSAIATASILYEQTPPTVLDVSWDDDTVVPYNASKIRISFDEPMGTASFVDGSFKLEKVSDSSLVDGSISLSAGTNGVNSIAELWGLHLAPTTSYKVTLSNAVTDAAGNAIGGANKTWFFSTGDAVDSSPPGGTVSLADPDGAGAAKVVTLPSGASATNSATLSLDFSAVTDDYNSLYGIKIWGDNDGAHAGEESFEQDASWIPWSSTVAWHASTSSGTKYILYKLMDSAGNESPSPLQLKVILDNAELPTIAAVSVNDGESYTNAADRKVGVTISAQDTYSGIKEMMVSNDAAFTGAVWQAWAPVIDEWTLPNSDGLKRFYVRVRDYLDQVSTTNSAAAITLDRTAPVVQFKTAQMLISADTRILEGAAGTDLYQITESYGIASYSWEKVSGPGALYFNSASGGGSANNGAALQEPWVVATVQGDYFLKVTVTDNAGNSASASVPLTWDTTAPGNVSNLTVPTYSTTGQPAWTWTAVADADFYRTSYNSGFSPYIDVYTNTFSPASQLAEGSHTLYVRAQDNAGNYSTPLNALVTVDTIPPAITVINNSFIANAANAATFAIDYCGTDGSVSAGSGTAISSTQWSKVSGSGTITFGSPNAVTTTVTASANDTYQLRLRVTDAAGNISYAYMTLLRDTTIPNTPTVTGPDITPSRYPTWYWTSGGGGIGDYRYRLDGGSWVTTSNTYFTSGTALSYPVDHVLEVQEIDSANNWSLTGSKTIHVDINALTPPLLSIQDGLPILRNVTYVTWNMYTGVGGAANAYRWQLDGTLEANWTVVDSPLPSPPTAAATLYRSGLSQGQHTIYVQEKIDSTWQTAKQATHTITVDTVAPNAPAVTGTGLATVTSSRTATPDTTPTWTWTSGGNGGNGKYSYRVTKLRNADGSANGTVLVNWTADTTATNYTLPVQAPTDGTYQLEIKERDDAGNWSALTTQLTTIDTAFPTMSGVVIRGTSHPSDTDYTYTNNVSVSVDITGNISSELNSAYSRPVKINMYDYNPAAWEDYATPFPTGTPTATTITTTLPTGDGTKYVYIRLIDEAGNTTSYAYDTIILDQTVPAGTFSVNSGAATTPSLTYNMTLSVTDNISAASELEVSLFNSNTGSWGAYRPYSPTMVSDSTFTASAGSKTAYVQIRDGAGNNLYYLSDAITLEVPVPTYAAKGQHTGGYTYVYYNPVTDPAGGTFTTRYYVYSTTDPNANPNNGDPVTYRNYTTATSSVYTPIPTGEVQYFFLRAYDTDTGGYGPYSAASVLGFSSNVTVVYDDDEPDDVTRATQIKNILTNTGIVDGTQIIGTMPTWTVTLLPEDLISNTYAAENQIYGDPVFITHGSTFNSGTTYDGRVRNIAASGKGTIAMGNGGSYYLYRVNANWTAWSMSGVSPTQPSAIHYGNTMGLTAVTSAKSRPSSSSEDIWFTPIYYSTLYNLYRESSVTLSMFSTAVERRGIYNVGGVSPSGGSVYAGDVYSADYYPVERQGEYCYFGYYEVPTVAITGHVFLINLTAKMDNY